jgi:hypothetical protein
MAVYRDVLRHFAVHADKVSVGGISNGGTGAWHLASKYPWTWAAVVPRAGVRLLKEEWVDNLSGLPAWIIHGSADHQIHVSNSRWMVERLRTMKNEVKYTEVPGGGHKFFPQLNPKIIRWMLRKRRPKLPRNLQYTPTRGKEAPIAWWLSCTQCGRVQARMKSTPTRTDVIIKAEKEPKGLKVWFPKGRADPRRPVRVLLNGDVVYVGKMTVSSMNVLDSFVLTGDLRRVHNGAVTVF